MSLVQDNHVVQAFAADVPDQPFDVRVLPRTPWGDQYFLDAHVADPPPERGAIESGPDLATDTVGSRPTGKLPPPGEPSTARWGVP